METTSLHISSDHKLINFNVPKYLIKNFDNLVKFKRVSRTSMLIHLMETYIRTEKKQLEHDNLLNSMIKDVEVRNRQSVRDEMIGLQKEISEELEPPMIPVSSDTSDVWSEDLSKDDWGDPSGVGRLWSLK